MKAVIDTNIWISFLIGKLLAGLDDYILDGLLEVVISDEQLEEITTVLKRPKFRKHFSADDIEEFLSLIYKTSVIVEIHHTIKDCRDEKDNFILETAIRGKADYIVTGDKDLLVLNPYRGKKIIGFREFEDIIKEAIKKGKS
ncbi:MAG: putative toxin-antitoxin system toxin component, PIN family [Thermodesulfovibrionales bacterium]|nr:putative toxin-antitoxin system toxin component, PIN family [Thermodesulfovibrionales bacterium]